MLSKISFVSFLVTLSSTGLAETVTLPSRCSTEATRIIDRPIFSGKQSATFKYRFGISLREDPNAPLIIFVPGGPGQTSMEMGLSYPNEFSVVRTDPRGLGCNEISELPFDSLSSEEIAHDILAIVRELKPKKYFIHAISYGTIPATMVAALAEKENLPIPSAVILEGTIGKAFAKDEYVSDVLATWKRLKPTLPQDVLKQISGSTLPFNLSSKSFAAWLSAILIYGVLPTGENYATSELSQLKSSIPDSDKEPLKNRINRGIKPPTANKVKLYKAISCREFVPDVRDVKFDYDFVNGDLLATTDRLCEGIAFDRPYDSKKYQIKSPIYYFSGDLDPVTPKSHARYHFDSQTNPRTLISIRRGGHQALSANLSDCTGNIWASILVGNEEKLKQAISTCALKADVNIEVR